MSSGYRNFQDEEVKPSSGKGGGEGRQAVNPYNANIVRGGGVNPSSSLYQRSIAGRQKLDVYLKDLWDKGGDEKDVFMAGVNSLMQRGHGYVGAYLDSKNPGRQYTRNEAMAITDQVMTNAGIGEHPGARLTGAGGETDEEKAAAKEKRKSDREARGEASKYGPQMDTGRKAMPVGQQRKLGKRPSTGVPAEPGDREGIGKRDAEGFYKNWQKEYSQKIKEIASAKAAGTITEEEAAQQLQQLKTESIAKAAKENQSRLSQSPQAQQGRAAKRREDRALDKTGTPGEEEAGGGAPGEEEEGLPPADNLTIGDKFKELFQGNVKANLPIDSKALEDLVGETIDILGEDYSIDPDQARKIIVSRFNNKNIDGYKLKFGNPPTQEAPEAAAQAPATQDSGVNIKYRRPNIEREWDEAKNYPEFQASGFEGWKNAVDNGKAIKYSQLKGKLGNVDLNYDSLDEDKKKRFEQAFQRGVIEAPIAVKFQDGSYDLVSGNTRLSGLVKNKIDPTILVVDAPSGESEEAQAQPPAEVQQPPASGGQVDRSVVQDIMEAGAKSPSVEEFKKEIMRQGHFRDIQGGAKTMGTSTTATAMAGQQAAAKRREAKAVKELNRSVSPQSKIDRFKQDSETGQWQRKGRKPAQPKQKGFDLENLPAWEPDKTPAPQKQTPAPEPQQPPAPEQQAPAPQQPQQQQAKKPGGQGFNRPAQQAPKPGVKRKSTFLDDVARAVQGGMDRHNAANQALKNLLGKMKGGKFSEYEEMSYEEFAQAVRSIIR